MDLDAFQSNALHGRATSRVAHLRQYQRAVECGRQLEARVQLRQLAVDRRDVECRHVLLPAVPVLVEPGRQLQAGSTKQCLYTWQDRGCGLGTM